MRYRYAIPLSALLAGALVFATGKLPVRLPSRAPTPPASTSSVGTIDSLLKAPDFSLVDQDDKPFARSNLAGKVWVADFIFTGCAGACPVLSEKLSRLQQTVDLRIHFVSFDVDPDHDTPAVLKQYGEKYHADFSRWHFLATPSRAVAFSIARTLRVTDQPDDRNFQLLHSGNFCLIDGDGKVRGIYDSDRAQALDQLAADAAGLLAK